MKVLPSIMKRYMASNTLSSWINNITTNTLILLILKMKYGSPASMKHHTTLIYDRAHEYFEKACQAHLYLLEEMEKNIRRSCSVLPPKLFAATLCQEYSTRRL